MEPEPSEDDIANIFETKTVAWTLQRTTTMQFFVMSEIIDELSIGSRQKPVCVRSGYLEDCFLLLAAGVEGWVRGTVTGQTLQATLKLHNFTKPSHWLTLPHGLQGKVDRLISPKILARPPYPWRGLNACGSSSAADYDGANCLKPQDTKRFLTFLERAWEEDWAVPFVKDPAHSGQSVGSEVGIPRFRQVELAQQLLPKLKVLRKFKHPCVFRIST
jgi:hypothetical protein